MNKPDVNDACVALLKGVIGEIPVVGSVIVEFLSLTIPDRRIERLEKYVANLAAYFSASNEYDLRERFKDPYFGDLFEESLQHVARSISDERILRISALINNAINNEDREAIKDKMLLRLLGELNDAELVILYFYSMKSREDIGFREAHKDVIVPTTACLESGQDVLDKETIDKEYRNHLVRLELLRDKFAKTKKGEVPSFDEKTGKIKSNGKELASLGRLLLRRVDLLGEDDY